MKNYYQFILCLLFCLVLTNCRDQQLPNTEIVYQTGSPDTMELGFVNSDGTGSVIWVENVYVIRPKWSAYNRGLYGIQREYQSILNGIPGYREENGKFIECEQWFNYEQVEIFGKAHETEILIANYKTVYLVDLENCSILNVFLDYIEQGDLDIRGVSYFSEKKLLLYGLEKTDNRLHRQYKIIKIDTFTDSEMVMGVGINPSWSPDGSQIAYVQSDGIYIMDADGSNPHLVLGHSFAENNGDISLLAPFPSWSPDGKWLAYHRCDKADCISITDYDIYKVNITSGEEKEIVQHGIFPDWKKTLP